MSVKWDAAGLHYFKRDGPMRGDHVRTRLVTFELHGEKVGSHDGAVVERGSLRRGLTPEPVDNTGSATIMIPEEFSKRFDRFFIQVHDAEADEVGGWSTGFFFVGKSRPAAGKATHLRTGVVPPAVRTPGGGAVALQQPASGLVESEERALISCASKFYFRFGVVASGGIDSFSILLFDVPIGIATSPVTLLPVKVVCV